ncbi:death-associated inhibitor of apoptosis 1 [Harpegnathos saltator]|uniref:death-associated inhibitor of apoptosis 1 n=1 Tax=Harpegnathos saltator TaxID=610380 RepID=UPI000DBEE1B4|nr:death-associated inhibitor of apoptosis 1 [Harpegnathos saltator]
MASMIPRRRFVTENDNDACCHNNEEDEIRPLPTTIQGSVEREFASSLQLEQPIYMQFDSFEQRLTTFDQWLRNALPSRRHHRDLAWVGFFYTGIFDLMMCYSCGIVLKNWYSSNERDVTITDDTFDPWREHLYWSRECSWAKVVCRAHFLNEDTAEPESEKAASLIPAPRRPIRFDRGDDSGDGVNGILGMEENKCTSVGETAQKRSSVDENECGLNLRRFTAYDNQRRRGDFDERIADRMLMGYIPVATRSIDTNDTVGVITLSDRLNDLRLATQRDIKENSECKHECIICYEYERNVLFLPCQHTLSCTYCSENLTECPVSMNSSKSSSSDSDWD